MGSGSEKKSGTVMKSYTKYIYIILIYIYKMLEKC